MTRINKTLNHTKGNTLLFLCWPFAAFIIAMQTFHLKKSRRIVYLFFILFGLTIVLGNENLDSFRYNQYFQETSKLSFSEFRAFLANFLISEKTLDLAQPIISFIVSRITDDYRLLFGVIAAIFGFFYIKSINIVHRMFYLHKSSITLLFLLFFALIINPIFNINGFRFWTATWIFFFGAYQLISLRQIKYISFCILSVLFHFSFIVPNVALLAYFLIGNRNKLYFVFLISSFFISDIVFNFFPHIIDFFGEGITAKAGRYTSIDQIKQLSEHAAWAEEQGKWYLYLPGKAVFYYIVFSFFYIYYKYKNFIKTTELKNLFSFSLFFLAFANTISFIPSMYRFRSLFYLFGLAVTINILTIAKVKKIDWLFFVGLIIFCMNLIVVLRLGIDLINPWLFTLLPFPFIFDGSSIYQIIFN